MLPLTLRSGFDFPSAVRLARTVREQELDLVHAHDARSHAVARVAQGVCRTEALSDNLFVTRRSLGTSTGRLDRLKYASPGTHYIAISTAVRDSLLRLGVRRESIVVVPSGIDVQRFAAVARLERDPWQLRQRGVWIVGTVGELSREKNHAMLLDALGRVRRQLPDTHLLLVGDGPKRGALEQRVRLLGLADAVTFAGRLDDVLPAYGAFDVFAFPSDTEGLGTALLDAMSAGVPVVATAAGGVLDIARHGESALVVPPRDPEAFAGALVRLRQQPELASHLARTAREVAARYDIDRMVDGTLAAYARLGSAGGRAARWEPESGPSRPGPHRNETRRPGTRPPVTGGPRP